MCGGRLGSHRSESLGHCSFPLLYCIVFSNVRVGVRQWGPELAGWGWGWTHLTFHLQKGLHLFDDCGVGAKSCAPWCALDYLHCPVSSKYMGPLHGHDLHFHIHHLYQEFAPEETIAGSYTQVEVNMPYL